MNKLTRTEEIILGIQLPKSHGKISGNHIPPRWKQILRAYLLLLGLIVSGTGFLLCLSILFN